MMRIRTLAVAGFLALGLSPLALAQKALIVSGTEVDAACQARIEASLDGANIEHSAAVLETVPEGVEINAALLAQLAEAGPVDLLVTLDMPGATYAELQVPSYANTACDSLFMDEGGEAVLERAFEIGESLALQAVVILYPETTAGSIAVNILTGFGSVAKPSIAQVAEQIAAVEGDPAKTMMIETKNGYIGINLRDDLAPNHAARLTELAKDGFYDGIVFHRVIDGFMAQTGDPSGTGRGGSDLPNLEAEFTEEPFVRGTVGMARSQDPNSANSQFFIMFDEGAFLNGQYTVVGEVLIGMEAVDQIKRGEPNSGTVTNPDRMQRVFMLADAL